MTTWWKGCFTQEEDAAPHCVFQLSVYVVCGQGPSKDTFQLRQLWANCVFACVRICNEGIASCSDMQPSICYFPLNNLVYGRVAVNPLLSTKRKWAPVRRFLIKTLKNSLLPTLPPFFFSFTWHEGMMYQMFACVLWLGSTVTRSRCSRGTGPTLKCHKPVSRRGKNHGPGMQGKLSNSRKLMSE